MTCTSFSRTTPPTRTSLADSAPQMRLNGADVWFDEGEIRAGDSIPGKVNQALETVDTIVLLWSSDADRSKWVRAEFETALARGMEDGSLRVIPVLLEDTPVPALLQGIIITTVPFHLPR